MDVTTTSAITSIIGSLGFPIAACIFCGWYIIKIQTQNNETLNKMSEALNNNTTALTRLAEKIDCGKVA